MSVLVWNSLEWMRAHTRHSTRNLGLTVSSHVCIRNRLLLDAHQGSRREIDVFYLPEIGARLQASCLSPFRVFSN